MAGKNLIALIWLGAAASFLTACGSPADETWIKITAFQQKVDDTTKENIAFLESELRNNQTDYVDVVLKNFTTLVGSSGSKGVGIVVYRVHVKYLMGNYSFPDYEYPVTLYLPPPGDKEDSEAGTAILRNLPLVPVTFKGWLLDPRNFPADISDSRFRIEARVIILARTDEGRELETSGGLGILFK